jgi:hypothetical protein
MESAEIWSLDAIKVGMQKLVFLSKLGIWVSKPGNNTLWLIRSYIFQCMGHFNLAFLFQLMDDSFYD